MYSNTYLFVPIEYCNMYSFPPAWNSISIYFSVTLLQNVSNVVQHHTYTVHTYADHLILATKMTNVSKRRQVYIY